ncbi:MAG: hypothetical protein WA584_06120 [Pyrinomonadaceae bacterium]
MNNEFEFDPEDLEFEDFNSELTEEDFEDFDDDELEEVSVRTAILSKNNMLALLCVKTATEGGAICRVDPRESRPAVQIYDDPAKAIEWFTKSLRTSKANGWQVVYDGLPMQG